MTEKTDLSKWPVPFFIWLSQKLMAQLFNVDVRTVNEHLKNIFDQGELIREATIRKFRIVQTEGNRKNGDGVCQCFNDT